MTSAVETSALQQAINDLERQLPELSAREESLRKELQEAEQRLSAARQALQHLRVLTGTIQPGPATTLGHEKQPEQEPAGAAPEKEAQQAQPEAPAPADEAAATVPQPRTPAKKTAGKTPRAAAAGKKPATDKAGAAAKKPATDKAEEASRKPRTTKTTKPAAKKKAPAGSRAAAPAAEEPAKVASPLLTAALAVLQKHGAAMRPADINTALGREDTAGQRESLRNTLERAVKAGQLKRPGRGQYSV
ncbi:hypothetical protein [Streptomyces sp. NPDC045470]|uniref:hypothetical protein n=1 Tax=unclassified Streptomyces TaxID=2593676 RepID=UPI0033FB64A1